MIKGKKGDAFEVVIWLVRYIFIIIVLFVMWFFIDAFILNSIDTKEVEAHVFIQRTIYSKHALAMPNYYTQRIYPGVSNALQFYSQDFDKSIDYLWDDQLAANITLKDYSKLYNEHSYNNWLPLVEYRYMKELGLLDLEEEKRLEGAGAITEINFNTTMLYYDGIKNSVVPLRYRVFVPNS